MAKAPDGNYKFSSGSGEISIGTQSVDLTRALLKEIGSVKNGSVTVKKGAVLLNGDAARNILNTLIGIDADLTVTGPSSMSFDTSGNTYVAKTPKPVVVKFTADYAGSELGGVLRSRFSAKITGGKLVINVKYDGVIGFVGSVDQQPITGSATIVCNR